MLKIETLETERLFFNDSLDEFLYHLARRARGKIVTVTYRKYTTFCKQHKRRQLTINNYHKRILAHALRHGLVLVRKEKGKEYKYVFKVIR